MKEKINKLKKLINYRKQAIINLEKSRKTIVNLINNQIESINNEIRTIEIDFNTCIKMAELIESKKAKNEEETFEIIRNQEEKQL